MGLYFAKCLSTRQLIIQCMQCSHVCFVCILCWYNYVGISDILYLRRQVGTGHIQYIALALTICSQCLWYQNFEILCYSASYSTMLIVASYHLWWCSLTKCLCKPWKDNFLSSVVFVCWSALSIRDLLTPVVIQRCIVHGVNIPLHAAKCSL